MNAIEIARESVPVPSQLLVEALSVRIDVASGAVEEIAGKLPIGLPAYQGAPPTFILTGVAMSATGTIYMTSNIENAIYKFTPQ
jgi:hypothetical protein